MASTEQEARNRKPLQQMLALKPRVEFGLMAGTAIVPDRENSRVSLSHRPARHSVVTTICRFKRMVGSS
jgi:hypothetical protein